MKSLAYVLWIAVMAVALSPILMYPAPKTGKIATYPRCTEDAERLESTLTSAYRRTQTQYGKTSWDAYDAATGIVATAIRRRVRLDSINEAELFSCLEEGLESTAAMPPPPPLSRRNK